MIIHDLLRIFVAYFKQTPKCGEVYKFTDKDTPFHSEFYEFYRVRVISVRDGWWVCFRQCAGVSVMDKITFNFCYEKVDSEEQIINSQKIEIGI